MDRDLRIANMASRQERMNAARADRAARLLGLDDSPTLREIATAVSDLMADALHLIQRTHRLETEMDFGELGTAAWDAFGLEKAREREDFLRQQELPAGDLSPAAPPEDPEEAR